LTRSVAAGVGVRDLLMEGSLTGIGAGWSVPGDQTRWDENVIECFQRVPVTDLADHRCPSREAPRTHPFRQ
jgi:hypothetical protein